MSLRAVPFAALAALLHAGCGEPPPPRAATQGPEGPAATGAGEGASYDPARDPLVNPPSLTQAYDAKLATEDETLVGTLDGSPQTLNPLFASSVYETRIAYLLWANPFTFNAKMEWAVDPDVVERYETSPDRKTWTVKLKPGLTWHDGVPWTAHDIEYSWKECTDSRVPITSRDGPERLESVKALDDLTVQYVAKEPAPTSKWDIGFSVIPKHLYEKGKSEDPTLKTSAYYAKLNRQPVGSGAYRFVEWKENDKIVLERWDGYKGAAVGHFKRIVFRIIPDGNVQLLTFEKGETDEMRLLAKQFAIETVRSDAFRRLGVKGKAPQWSYNFICWNQRGNPFFGDVRVRRAMTMAINVPQLIEKVTYRIAEPQCGPFHPTSPMYDHDLKPLPFDLAGSARLLDEAGWRVDPETGWRQKDGVPFSFTVNFGQGSPQTVDMCTAIQQSLKTLGVEMKLQPLEWATMQERNRKHEFQATTLGWSTGVDPESLRNVFSTKAIDDGRNYGCYSNPRVDELFDRGQKEFDVEKRMRVYQEIARILHEDQPYTFLWSTPTMWAFNRRIRGVGFSPRGVWGFDPGVFGWWVTKEEQAYR